MDYKERKIRRVKSKNGRVYEYPPVATPLTRKQTKHHPDFEYKATIFRDKKAKGVTIRQQCLLRDGFMCQSCGKPESSDVRLIIHHKDGEGYSRVAYPNNNLDNLVTLCYSCHEKLHTGVSFSREYEIYWLRLAGLSFEDIGNQFNISRQRVYQIYKGLKAK